MAIYGFYCRAYDCLLLFCLPFRAVKCCLRLDTRHVFHVTFIKNSDWGRRYPEMFMDVDVPISIFIF
jgi:hypothetical protein